MDAKQANPAGYVPDQCVPASKDKQVMNLLRALGIEEIEYHLDGGGDSGDTNLERILYADGREDTHLPELPISFSSRGEIHTLGHYLDDLASNLPEGDWINNEGGSGEVFIRPRADEEDWFECNMTYHDEDDSEDDFEEDDLDDDDDPATIDPHQHDAVLADGEGAQ